MREATAHLKTGGILIVCLAAAIASIHASTPSRDTHGDGPQAEFQMARVKYRTFGGGGSHGYFQPWWAIDYPLAEEHFFAALRRTTNIQIADEERHLELSDDQIFEYACHEGNHSIVGILTGARAQEQAAEQAKKGSN